MRQVSKDKWQFTLFLPDRRRQHVTDVVLIYLTLGIDRGPGRGDYQKRPGPGIIKQTINFNNSWLLTEDKRQFTPYADEKQANIAFYQFQVDCLWDWEYGHCAAYEWPQHDLLTKCISQLSFIVNSLFFFYL